MRVYISGPMTGMPNLNFEAFDRARDLLLSQGHWIVSPADLDRSRGTLTYQEALKDDLKYLLWCDAIYMLKGWDNGSFGAKLEHHIAQALGYTIMYE